MNVGYLADKPSSFAVMDAAFEVGIILFDNDPALQRSAKAYENAQQNLGRRSGKQVTNDGPTRSVDGTASQAFAGTTAADNPNLPYYVPTAYNPSERCSSPGPA